MAIQTIRDLAFKISMSVEISKLKDANKAVDSFKAKVINLQRSVSKNMQIVNKGLNNINTTKAVKRINDMTKATDKLKEAMGAVVPVQTETKRYIPKGRKSKKEESSGFELPNIAQWNTWSNTSNILKGLTKSGYYSTLLKIRNVGLQINTNSNNNLKLIDKQREATRGLLSSLKLVRDTIGKNNYALIGGVKGLSVMAVKALTVAGILKTMQTAQKAYNQSLQEFHDMTDGLVRQEAFYANALRYREQVNKEVLNTGANSYEEYRQAAQKSLESTRENIRKVARETVISEKQLTLFTGQLASFQINTDMWFGGKKGLENLRTFADAMAVLQNKTGSRDEALRTANMIGKAFVFRHFGQLNDNGIVVAEEIKKKMRESTDEAEKLNLLMGELVNNTANYNRELIKTPSGKVLNLQSKISSKLYELGKHTIYLKVQFLDLYYSFLPVLSIVIRLVSSVVGLFLKLISVVGKALSFLIDGFAEMSDWLKILRHILIGLAVGFGIAFFPVTATILGILILLEDLWVYLNGGESVIGSIIAWFGKLWDKIINGVISIKNKIIDMWGFIKVKFWEFIDWIKKWYKIIKDGFFEFVINIKNKIVSIFLSVGDKIRDLFNEKIQWITSKIDWLKTQFDKLKKLNPFADDEQPRLPSVDTKETTNNNPYLIPNTKPSILIQNGAIQIDMSNSNTNLSQADISKAVEDGLNNVLIKASIQEGVVY